MNWRARTNGALGEKIVGRREAGDFAVYYRSRKTRACGKGKRFAGGAGFAGKLRLG